MPSEVCFKANNFIINPEQEQSRKNMNEDDAVIKQFTIKGKGIFSIEPKYNHNQIVATDSPTFLAKAFDDEANGRGLRKLWETVVGYSKK